MKTSSKYLLGILICIWATIFLLFQDMQKISDGKLSAYFFAVPVGDGIAFKTPNGKIIAIDGGVDDTVVSKLSRLFPFWNRTIELLVLTHPDADHLNGALELIKKFPIRHVLISGAHAEKREFLEFLKTAQETQTHIILSDAKNDFTIDGVVFDILFPQHNLVGDRIRDMNNSSVTLRVSFGDHSFLLPGDNEHQSESEILQLSSSLTSSVLLAGHHGSKTSSGKELLSAVNPQYVIISAGPKNRFGHPHQEVLDRIQEIGAQTFVTKNHGDIQIISDGKNMTFSVQHD